MSTPLHPCFGRHDLFDSVDLVDHSEARALCLACPVLDECRALLDTAARRAYSASYGPEGTWAGQLVGRNIRTPQRIAREEAMFNDAESRQAHAAYQRGDRSDRSVIGERVYQRRRQQRRRAA